MRIKNLCLAVALFSASAPANSQVLSGYIGVGIGADNFIKDRSVTQDISTSFLSSSAQFVAGIRLRPHTSFALMADASLGMSKVGLHAANTSYRIQYQQVRSMLTVGSGLYLPLEDDHYVMPFIQLGAAFYDFNDLVAKDNLGSYSIHNDYNSKHWIVVCGVGVEYKLRLIVPATVNFRCLYTPTNIFPDPFKFSVESGTGTKDYSLQGRLLQFLFTVQIPFTIYKGEEDYYYRNFP